jgi:plasmid stability protein
MAVQITIRDVPEQVRDELAARAALKGQSMQEFLRAELARLAA